MTQIIRNAGNMQDARLERRETPGGFGILSRVHESKQEVREPIEIGQSSQAARVSKEMARDYQRSTCQRPFCAGLLQARGNREHHLLLLAELV